MKTIYTSGEVAKLCNVAMLTVNKWFDSGRLRGYRIPGSMDRRVPREYLIRFLKEYAMPIPEALQELTAEKRGQLMMSIPMDQLPPLAVKYAKKFCDEVGAMCAETLLTAWVAYAQCVEGLPCEDEAYKASSETREWFRRMSLSNES